MCDKCQSSPFTARCWAPSPWDECKFCGGRAQTLNSVLPSSSRFSPQCSFAVCTRFNQKTCLMSVACERLCFALSVCLWWDGQEMENVCGVCDAMFAKVFPSLLYWVCFSLAARRTKLICQHVVFNIYLKDGFISWTWWFTAWEMFLWASCTVLGRSFRGVFSLLGNMLQSDMWGDGGSKSLRVEPIYKSKKRLYQIWLLKIV